MSQRLHKNTVAGVIEALKSIFSEQLYADKVVDRILRQNKKWGKRDRAFVAKNTYDIVRYWRKLWAIVNKEPSLQDEDLETIFGIWWKMNGHDLPEWPMFDQLQNFDLEQALANLPEDIDIQESYPIWLHERALDELGDQWPSIAHHLNAPAPVAIRVNPLKTNKAELQSILDSEEVTTIDLENHPEALLLEGRPKLNHLSSYENGLFEVHDVGSQAIAPFVGAQPGETIIDACAGAGGKALHLAALMEDVGKITAMDITLPKLRELKKRAKRNGVSIIKTALIEGKESLAPYYQSADRLLLDVPCSGTGVIRRDVDTKWKLQPSHLEKTIKEQRYILNSYSEMLKPGGTLVYATCSIFKSENEDQIKWFLDYNPGNFEFIEEQRVDPSPTSDGFYMARLKKIQ